MASESSPEWDFGSPIAFEELETLEFYKHPDSEDLKDLDVQTPSESLMSSQTVIGTSSDLSAGCQTSSKRKRANSLSDCTRNVQRFVTGSNGDSLPHYLTVSLVAF